MANCSMNNIIALVKADTNVGFVELSERLNMGHNPAQLETIMTEIGNLVPVIRKNTVKYYERHEILAAEARAKMAAIKAGQTEAEAAKAAAAARHEAEHSLTKTELHERLAKLEGK